MKTIEEIENYIKEQEQNGALLVTGKWGSGKTYLMRQIERKLNQGPQYLMAVVSLFGIEDTNTLTKKVKEAVVYAQTFNKAEKSGKGHIAKGVNVVKQLSEKVAAFGELFDFGKIKKIAKSANMLLSIDVYDFLPIEKEVYCIVAGEEQPVKKKLVLVFDDFERCKIGVIDLLGIINTYVEDKGIKTVIIASEDNIKDEENYKTFKEKVVERTVKLDVEYRRIQQEMIGNYKAKTSEYTEFLKTESPKLFQVFEESETRNLRTFKSCLIDFERVYELWCRLKLPTDGMGGALYVFAAYLFEVKGGNYKKLNEYDSDFHCAETNPCKYVDYSRIRSCCASCFVKIGSWNSINIVKNSYSQKERIPMKTNESLLHKGMRTIVQSALRREANEPCHVCWVYQPHRPEKPLPQPQDKK